MGCLYRLRSPSGKCYYGITVRTIKSRWGAHVADASKGFSRPISRAIRRYGAENFTIEVLAFASDFEFLKFLEKRAIERFESRWPRGYNATAGGEGSLSRYPGRSESERIEAYRKRKREYARSPAEKTKRQAYNRDWWDRNRAECNRKANEYHAAKRRNQGIEPRRILMTVNGETKSATEWAVAMGLDRHTVAKRIRQGWSHEDAVLTPNRTRYVTAWGETKSLTAWVKERGMGFHLVKGRLKRGWTPEDALSVFPGTVRHSPDPAEMSRKIKAAHGRPEVRAKVGAAVERRKNDPNFGAKISAGKLGKKIAPCCESKKVLFAELRRKEWADPVIREQRIAAIREGQRRRKEKQQSCQ